MFAMVKFRGKDFVLDDDIDHDIWLMLETCLPEADPLPGSFAITKVIGDNGTDNHVVIVESPVYEKLPFDAERGFEPGEDGMGEVYIFWGGDRKRDEVKTIVLWGSYTDEMAAEARKANMGVFAGGGEMTP